MAILTNQPARLSAFAAAKAKAAANQTPSDQPSKVSVIAAGDVSRVPGTNGGAAAENTQLSTLLSSFPLTKTQELDSHASSDDEQDDSDFDGSYSRPSNGHAYKTDQPCKLSNLPPDSQCVISDTPEMLSLRLGDGETATFVGEYDLRVQSGYVMIYGAVLRSGPTKHRVYAPTTHALPVIIARGGPAEVDIISVTRSLGPLSKVSPLWTKLWHAQTPKDTHQAEPETRSFALLRSSSDDPLKRAVTALEVEQDCQITLNRVLSRETATHPSSVIMVSGPKGSGKSTICKSTLR